jgi:predicted kinase
VISTDDMIQAHAASEGLTYSQAWRALPSHKLDSRARALLREAVEQGLDVIVDRTNLRASGRAKFLRILPEAYERRAVVFVTPFELLRERLQRRAAAGGHGVGWGIVVT